MKVFRGLIRGLLGTKVLGTIPLFLLLMQYGLPWTTAIDTREGGAQQRLAYIFTGTGPRTMRNTQAFYGGVEFRKGVQSNNASSLRIILGVSAPMNGVINVPATGSQFWINLKNDLWFNFMDFTTAATGLAIVGFQWGAVDGDTTPYNIFFTRDVTVHSNVWLDLVPYTGYGTLDGQGNTLILMDGSRFTADSKNASVYTLLKNLIIQGAQNLTSTVYGTSYFQNVSMFTTGTGLATTHINNRNIVYSGLTNVLGGGGVFDLTQVTTGKVRLTSASNVYVAPNTQLRLGNAAAVAASTFLFDDTTATLFLDNSTLSIGGCLNDHITFTAGTVYINGNVTLHANFAGSYLQLGDAVSASHNCNVVVLPGSKLILDNGAKLVNYNV